MPDNATNTSDRACPLCHRGKMALLYRKIRESRFDVVRCSSCQVQSLLPQPKWEEVKAIYDAGYYKAWGMEAGENAEVARMKKATFRRRLVQLRRHHSSGRILDVGTASGFFLEAAAAAGFDPYGVELSEYAGKLATKKFGVDHIHIGLLETSPFPAASFAAVVMSDLLEHVPDPASVLRHARDLLQPGGVLLVMTPNTDSISRRLMGGRWTHYKPEHLHYFNRRSVSRLAEGEGLESVSFEPAVKMLTLRYLRSQLATYPHPVLTPLSKILSVALRPFVDLPFPLIIGEFVAIFRRRVRA